MTKSNDGGSKFVIELTLIAAFGGMLFGYDTAVISGAVGAIQSFIIDSLNIENGEARKVVLEYRITVFAVIYVVLIAVGGILVKLLGRGQGISSTAFISHNCHLDNFKQF